MERKDVSSWLEGPPQLNSEAWPGQRLGRPASGPGSVARMGRRVGALFIDWALAMIPSFIFFHGSSYANLAFFAAMQIIFVGLTGHSIGHRTLGMQVQGMDGSPVRPIQGLIRGILVCLVVPPLVTDPDQRGLHDRAIKTILVRT
ncbi:RDD family protein [Arthrobacter rhombi]|uniref:RDD family protein n=1 Tax=Arthrobacter rhombi TaxID=71253 RepID=UPI003FD5815F